jgi:hypothetical protein
MKSQGSAASNRKTLQSQIRQSAQNRLSINALDIVHGQLGYGLEVRHQAAGKPNQFDIALALPLQATARSAL